MGGAGDADDAGDAGDAAESAGEDSLTDDSTATRDNGDMQVRHTLAWLHLEGRQSEYEGRLSAGAASGNQVSTGGTGSVATTVWCCTCWQSRVVLLCTASSLVGRNLPLSSA